MDAAGGRRSFDPLGSGHRRRLPVLLVAIAVTSLTFGATAAPLVSPVAAQTGPTAELTASPNPANPGELVTLDARNSSSPNGSIVRCEFDLDGDGQYTVTADDCVVETSYDTVGEYVPTVRVLTSNDRTATDSVELTVAENRAPVPRITVDPATPEPGEAVVLSGATSTDADGRIESYVWDLPSGQASGETVETSFEEPGEYPVTLTVVDDDGAENATEQVVTVAERNDPPTAELRVVTEVPRVDEPVELDASGSADPDGSIRVYAWDFDGDGAVDRTTEAPGTAWVPTATGTTAVAVTVIDDGGASETATVRFEVAQAATEPPSTTPTAAPTTPPPNSTDEGTLSWIDRGLIPFVPDILGLLLVLLLLVGAGAAVSVLRSDLAAERADRLRDLLTRGDVRHKIAQKLSGTTVKTAAKKAIRRLSDLIEASGEGVGDVFERIGRWIKRTSKRAADWLRQFGT